MKNDQLLVPTDFIKNGKPFNAVTEAIDERQKEVQSSGDARSRQMQQDWSKIANKVVGAEGVGHSEE